MQKHGFMIKWDLRGNILSPCILRGVSVSEKAISVAAEIVFYFGLYKDFKVWHIVSMSSSDKFSKSSSCPCTVLIICPLTSLFDEISCLWKNRAVIVLVREPINQIPTTIRTAATTRPAGEVGEMSPYPTVVAVTKLHHIPSEKLIPSTKCIVIPPITIQNRVTKTMYLRPLISKKNFTRL